MCIIFAFETRLVILAHTVARCQFRMCMCRLNYMHARDVIMKFQY